MFGLYATGIVGALAVSCVAKRLFWRTTSGEPFMLEMPGYKLPQLRSLAIGVWARAMAFLKRAGTTILSMMILIWVLASFPGAPEGATEPAITYSLAAMIGHAIEPITTPLGFNWQINVALIPGMAAREVAVGALGTIYAIDGGDGAAAKIGQVLAGQWSLATALALLAWYVFAPQCASTLGRDPPRDRRLEVDVDHLRLHAGARLCRGLRHLPDRPRARRRLISRRPSTHRARSAGATSARQRAPFRRRRPAVPLAHTQRTRSLASRVRPPSST